ncbi:MAG TPA: NADAR family protein [Polyangiaceae bacterium]|nr:NADAR family protein [Polyangiaceae bacterium]
MWSSEPPYTRERLVEAIAHGLEPTYLFFWGHTAKAGSEGRECLSQWYPAPFSEDGVCYPTAEHYMMAGKARLFGDEAMLAAILKAVSPAEAKQLGRRVQGFVDAQWKQHCSRIVVSASVLKFGQNPRLGSFLLASGDSVIVEASPRDRIWGIGMSRNNPRARDPRHWRGQNLLGFALMTARHELRHASRTPA